MSPTIILDIGLITMLLVVAFAIIRMRSLFAIVMLQGVYSLITAAWFVTLDAVDVAFTEAAVGAGVSTVLMLAAMLLADRESNEVSLRRQIAPIIIVVTTGLALFYAIGDMPLYGDAHSPANSHVGTDYLALTDKDIHIPNVVTAVLASYRGFDTFGEAVVIFAAGLGVLLLLGLNGNAGKWRAQPNGIRVGRSPAPAAGLKPGANIVAPNENPKPQTKAKRKTKAKTTTAKITETKLATAKTAPKKTRGRPRKTAANKTPKDKKA